MDKMLVSDWLDIWKFRAPNDFPLLKRARSSKEGL